METKWDLVQYCLAYKDVYEDYPFRNHEWAMIRHRKNKKVFTRIYRRNDEVYINPRYVPEQIGFRRNAFTTVKSGYHLNKKYWSTVVLDGTVPDKNIKRMVGESYDLTK